MMMILSILFLDFMPKYPVMITKTLTCHLMMALVISAVVCCKIVAFSVFAVPHTARCVMMINIIITILSNSISVSLTFIVLHELILQQICLVAVYIGHFCSVQTIEIIYLPI